MAEAMSLKEKQKLLGNLVAKTQKKYNSPFALSFGKDRIEDMKLQFIPTPSENLNQALGGGFARGRISEVSGTQSSGKTSLLLEMIALDMKNDPDSMWGWIESEQSFDSEYAYNIKGIDPTRLLLAELDDVGAEPLLDQMEMLIRSSALKGIVVNSVAALSPKAEMEGGMERMGVGEQARMMSKLMRKTAGIIGKTKTAVIYINQLRTDINVKYGDPNTTTGGQALRFYATQRIKLSKVKLEEKDGLTEDEGLKINVKVLKNRCVYKNPYVTTSYTAIYGQGIDAIREIGNLAIDNEVVAKSGAWIYYPSKDNVETIDGIEMKFSSKANFLDAIRGSEVLQEFLREKIRNAEANLDSLDDDEIRALEQIEKQDAQEMALPEEEGLGLELGEAPF